MSSPELLSPAGTLECAVAAFHYGADAVYLGMKEFSARADAGNFSFEELSILSGLAHQTLERRRKIYVAVNTLLRESELDALAELLLRLRDAEVDALIVQDAAVARLVAQLDLGLELHCSTQMAIHNVEGVQAAKRLGYTRVVAAREVGLSELTAMAAVPGMEIEAFVHGALCYSYSGLCLMSACTNGCSGNRGECTYVCRKRFGITGPGGESFGSCSPMSMKDLSLVDAVGELVRSGVASLKIEGRKKTPLYVAAVTNLYRKLLDHSFADGEELESILDVKTIFSRPWTPLFARSRRNSGVTDPKMLGPRGIEVGQVSRVLRRDGQDWLRFTLKTRPLERHDGLQVELPGCDKPFGFGIDLLREYKQGGQERWDGVFEAAPGRIIEVPLPSEHPAIPIGARVCCASSQAVKRRYQWPELRVHQCRLRNPVRFMLQVGPRSLRVSMWVERGGRMLPPVEVAMELAEPLGVARQPDRMQEEIQACFARLGDSDFTLAGLQCDNPGGWFVPKSVLNELRRQVVAKASGMALEVPPIPPAVRGEEESEHWSWKIDSLEALEAIDDRRPPSPAEEIVFSLERIRPRELPGVLEALEGRCGGREHLRLSLPVVSRGRGAAQWREVVRELSDQGWRRWEAGNLAALEMVDLTGLDVIADWPLYAMNHLAASYWLDHGFSRVTACPEDHADNILALAGQLGSRLVVPVYQRVVVARSAACIMNSIRGFCPGRENCTFTTLNLDSGHGESFTAVNQDCTTLIVQNQPLDYSHLLPDLRRAGVRYFRWDGCRYLV